MRPVLIAGATASGKSALALAIAERDGGCVINADAAQVYGCWHVLTARPSRADLARAPHALYGHVSCGERYSVGAWLRELAPLLATLDRQGRRAVIVGGTGLYLSALTEGLAVVPPVPRAVRARSEALMRAGGTQALRADLAARDPATLARIDAANPRRVQRAWEVLAATGRGLSDWQADAAPPLLASAATVSLVLDVDKQLLDRRISERLARMLEEGALDECRGFAAAGLDRALPAAKVLGAPEFLGYLDGRRSLEDATAAAAAATRRFAKRQRTWLRGRMRDWQWIDAAGNPLAAVPPA